MQIVFKGKSSQFLHFTTQHDLPNDYPLLFNNTQLNPSSSLNILGVSFSRDLSWKDHIYSLTKSASMKLGMLYRLKKFFTPDQLLSLYRGHIRPCMEYASHIWGGSSHVSLLDVEKKAFRLINLPKLTDSIQPLHQRRDVGTLSFLSLLQWTMLFRNL